MLTKQPARGWTGPAAGGWGSPPAALGFPRFRPTLIWRTERSSEEPARARGREAFPAEFQSAGVLRVAQEVVDPSASWASQKRQMENSSVPGSFVFVSHSDVIGPFREALLARGLGKEARCPPPQDHRQLREVVGHRSRHLKTPGGQQGRRPASPGRGRLRFARNEVPPEPQSWRPARAGDGTALRPPAPSWARGSPVPTPKATSHRRPRVGLAGEDTGFPCSLTELALGGQKARSAAGKLEQMAVGRQRCRFRRRGALPRAPGKPEQSASPRLCLPVVFLGPRPRGLSPEAQKGRVPSPSLDGARVNARGVCAVPALTPMFVKTLRDFNVLCRLQKRLKSFKKFVESRTETRHQAAVSLAENSEPLMTTPDGLTRPAFRVA